MSRTLGELREPTLLDVAKMLETAAAGLRRISERAPTAEPTPGIDDLLATVLTAFDGKPAGNVEQVAAARGASRPVVFDLVREGKIKSLKLGRSRRFVATDVVSFIREHVR